MAARGANINLNDNNAHMIYIPVGVFAILSPLLVGLRTWARLRKGGKMGADDYTIIAALTCCLMSSGVMIASCHYGFGRHLAAIELEDLYKTMKFFYVCQVSYKASINLTKCSILLLYLRIFERVRWFRLTCWFLIICVSMYCIASVLVTVFQCTPIEKSFNNSLEGRCINNGQFWYANAGFSIATDVLIYLIPMPLICKLQIPWVQRIAIMMVFAMGGFVIVTSCLRLTTINIIAHTTDLTFQISSTMWTVIEPNVAIICACLPMIRPLIAKAFPKLKFHSKKGSENRWTDPTSHSGSNAARGSQANDRGEWLELEAGKPDEFRMASATQVGTMSSEVTIAGI